MTDQCATSNKSLLAPNKRSEPNKNNEGTIASRLVVVKLMLIRPVIDQCVAIDKQLHRIVRAKQATEPIQRDHYKFLIS